MPISPDTLDKTKDNYIVYHYERDDKDKELEDEISALQQQLLEKYRELDHRVALYIEKNHPILKLNSERKVGLKTEFRKMLDAGSIVEWTTNRFENGKLRRPKLILYVERISDLQDATGYFEERLKWTVDIDFSGFVKLDCIRMGNKSILKLTGRSIDEAQKEHDEKRKKK